MEKEQPQPKYQNMFNGIYFESERLKTCQLHIEDTKSLFQMYSDSEAMKYRGSGSMKTIEDAHKMIENQSVANDQISKLRLGIRHKITNHLIGTLLLTKNDLHTCEIGFSFGKEHWNQGYGKETLGMVVKKLNSLDTIKSISAWCIKENKASNRLFIKAGFKEIKQTDYPQSNLYIKKTMA